MGDAMQLSFDVLPSAKTGFCDGLAFYAELEAWSFDYERRCMVPHGNNHITATHTQNLLPKNVPRILQTAVSSITSASMDDRLRIAIMFDEPSPLYRGLPGGFLTARKFYLRFLSLPRPKFMSNALLGQEAGADGRRHFTRYETFPCYVKPTIYNRWGPRALASRLMVSPCQGTEAITQKASRLPIPGPGHARERVRLRRKTRSNGYPFLARRQWQGGTSTSSEVQDSRSLGSAGGRKARKTVFVACKLPSRKEIAANCA